MNPKSNVPIEVLDWLRSNAVHFSTTLAGGGFSDLENVASMVGEATIILLGEATHGTREFFQMKHRLLEYLASECSFFGFAIEAGWAESLAVEQFLQTGKGDPAEALAGLGYWVWNTIEVLEMIRWMRRWNECSEPGRRLHFYGFDMQSAGVAACLLVEYIESLDPLFGQRARELLAPFIHTGNITAYRQLDIEERTNNSRGIHEVSCWLSQLQSSDTSRVLPAEPLLVQQHMRTLQQYDTLACAPNQIEADKIRDSAMASNVSWIHRHLAPSGKLVVWAHNDHIQRCIGMNGVEVMGEHLAREFGQRVLSVGFCFNEGGFQAIGNSEDQSIQGVREIIAPPAPEGSLDAALAANETFGCLVDLRSLPPGSVEERWFSLPHLTHSIGSVCMIDDLESWFSIVKVLDAYDILLFVSKTNRAAPVLPRRRVNVPSVYLPTPKNLDFEQITPDGQPGSWLIPSSNSEGYSVALVDGNNPLVGRCVQISGHPNAPGTYGRIIQRVDASSYRSQQICFGGMLRADGNCEARLWFRVDCLGGYLGFFDNMDASPVKSDSWQNCEIAGIVDDDAVVLSFGVMMLGEGSIWAAQLRLDILRKENT